MSNQSNGVVHHQRYRGYDQAALLQRQAAQQLCVYASEHVQAGMRIVDAGCGTGYLSEFALAQGALVWALDLSISQLQQLPEHPQLVKLHANINHIPLPDASVDMVMSSFSLHWMGIDVLPELLRVTRPQGQLWLAIPVLGSLQHLASQYTDFPLFNFLPEQLWLTAAGKHVHSYWVHEFSQPVRGIQEALQLIRSVGGTQRTAHPSAQLLALRRQQWLGWLQQDQQRKTDIEFNYRVLMMQLMVEPLSW